MTRSAQSKSLAMLTDLYELTMAHAYWKSDLHEREAVFHLLFREHPFQGGFTVACGLALVMEILDDFRFTGDDIRYLASFTGNDGKGLFDEDMLKALHDLRLTCDIDAVEEGTVVFPQEPLVRVQGPLWQCQLLETILLNIINFQSLIATKAARVCLAAGGDPVVEFGLRRAQGVDGGLSASRAAYIGGCQSTSNALAGEIYGIPVKGTMAHSWIMSFDSELAAFEQYARVMPNNCIFLVDTYNTLNGVRNAIKVGQSLRARGHEMAGIRLDSGDLAYLSIEARRLLDENDFPKARILASNNLDEHIIASLKQQGARIDIWGVGTKLVTAYDQPALGGIYKLSALRDAQGRWQHKLKLSEQTAKISNPGIQQVRRFRQGRDFIGDTIYQEGTNLSLGCQIIDPEDPQRYKQISAGSDGEDLLKSIYRGGRRVYDAPDIHTLQGRARESLAGFHPGIKRFVYPHQYPAGLERSLFELKMNLIGEKKAMLQQQVGD